MDTHSFPLALTFDDVLLVPGYTDFSRSAIKLSTQLTKEITLQIPLVSSPMDTVTESRLAIELGKLGGIGMIHRNLSASDQATEVQIAKQAGVVVGAAVGSSTGYEERVEALMKAGVDVLLVDTAHGFTKTTLEIITTLKNKYKVQIIAGNISTADAAAGLIKSGADGLRVGMGPGAICTTRVISGMGVPQITALLETVKVAKKHGVPVIADGGIKYSGDMVKALATGATACMMGSYFASAEEAPGEVMVLDRAHVPSRFKSILKDDQKEYKFKEYRGMGSIGAMQKGAKIKSEDEYHGKDYKDRVLVAEGVEGLVPIKGTLKQIVDQALGGIKSGMYYVGAKTIGELHEKARFMQITQASLTESHPHDVLITNPGKNY